VICYLSDDDLYLPDHVQTVIGLLREADFEHSVPVRVDGSGALAARTIDLSMPEHRHWIANTGIRIPLSTGAHLRSAGELFLQLDRALTTVSRQRDLLDQVLAERTAALADAQGHSALLSQRPEAAALRLVAQLRRARRAVLRRAS
jgi:hypothetical protein